MPAAHIPRPLPASRTFSTPPLWEGFLPTSAMERKGRERAWPLPRTRASRPRCARCASGTRVAGLAESPRGPPRGDGWAPYGLPQLPLVVQLALQAARALLGGVRLLLQAPDLPPHRLQRAAPRHGAGRRPGCGARSRLLRSGSRAPVRPAQAVLRDGGAPCGPGTARKSRLPPRRQRRTAGGRASAGGRGAERAPRTPGSSSPPEALRMLAAAAAPGGLGCSGARRGLGAWTPHTPAGAVATPRGRAACSGRRRLLLAAAGLSSLMNIECSAVTPIWSAGLLHLKSCRLPH